MAEPLPSFETLLPDHLYALSTHMDVRQFYYISRVSNTLRHNILTAVAQDWLGKVCSKLVGFQDEVAAGATLKALKEHKSEVQRQLCLKINVDRCWEGSGACTAKIEEYFKPIPRVILVCKQELTGYFPTLPTTLEELTLHGFDFERMSISIPPGLKSLKVVYHRAQPSYSFIDELSRQNTFINRSYLDRIPQALFIMLPEQPALEDLKREVEIAEKDADINRLRTIASIFHTESKKQKAPLSDQMSNYAKELCDKVFALVEKKRRGHDTHWVSYWEEIGTINPDHLLARLHVLTYKYSTERQRHIDELLPLALRDNNQLALLFISGTTEDPNVKARALDQMCDQARLIVDHTADNDGRRVKDMLEKKAPIDLIIQYYRFLRKADCPAVNALISHELAGGALHDLSGIDDFSTPFMVLHKLEVHRRKKSIHLKAIARRTAQNQWWSVILYLHKHALFPDLQIEILKENLTELNRLSDIKVYQCSSSAGLLCTKDNTNSCFFSTFIKDLIPLNARIALAELLLPREPKRAKELLQEILPFVLQNVSSYDHFMSFEALLSKHNLMPDMRRKLLEKALECERRPDALEKLADLLTRGPGFVQQDPKRADELVDEAFLLRFRAFSL